MVIYKDYIYVLYDHNTAYEEDKEDKPIDATMVKKTQSKHFLSVFCSIFVPVSRNTVQTKELR